MFSNFLKFRRAFALGLLTLFGILPFEVFAQEDARAIRIQWAAVPRARGYQVQVRNEGGANLYDRRVRGTLYEPRLEPGTYFYRIAAVGKNNNPGPFSQWIRLNVLPTRTPEIGRISPKEDTPRGKRIEITGEGFQGESKAFLVRPGRGRVELPVELVNSNTMSVYVSAVLLTDGAYDIVVENPRGLTKEREDAIQVEGGQVRVDRSAQRGARRSRSLDPAEVVPAPEPADRIQALWRSALVPGWGQIQQGRTGLGIGIAASQFGLGNVFSRRVRAANQARAAQNRQLLQNAYVNDTNLRSVDPRDDFFFWRRIGELRNARFSARTSEMHAATAGSMASAFYLWNVADVALYSGQGEDAVGTGGALWRSAILPGWGQYAAGRPLSGAMYSGGFVLAGAGAFAQGETVKALRKISAQHNLERIWSAHFTTGRGGFGQLSQPFFFYSEALTERRRITELKRQTRGAAGLAGAIYLLNLADLFIPWGALGGGGVASGGLYIGPTADGPAVGLSFRF